ncbi:MAG: CusA/CzcA family heavy metal efflux RND transporter, partial [bacterium]|nr:CusA/CzcA family heavy metal efflux RND transporter [bacterium]
MLEAILRTSIQQRTLVVMLAIGVAILGLFAFQQLPIDAVPDITNNQLQINTTMSGMSPLEIEKQVTFPMETALAGIDGLDYTRSLSRSGFSQITAVFHDSVDIYFARQQVGERLTSVGETLPPGAEPQMGAISTGLGEVMMWTVEFVHPEKGGSIAAKGEPGWQADGTYITPENEVLHNEFERAVYLRTVQDWIIRPQLKNVLGVAGIDSIGGYVKQYHVQPDMQQMMMNGLTFREVIEALEHNNLSTGAGYVERKGESYVVRADGRISGIDEISSIVVSTRHGTPLHLSDVAAVKIGKELRTGSASSEGVEVVVGTALMLIGANSRTVARAVSARLDEVRTSLPADVIAKTTINRTKLVDATIATVARNLTEGAILVIVVLFLMLGNFRAAFICALAIPMAMLMTATGMVKFGVSGNLMSLGAIDFGLIVDGAVIIVENCLRLLAERQRELGRLLTKEERLETVQKASLQVRGATAFGEAIIITVYLPLLALGGVEGKMFHPMAITVIIALVAAFILSLTLVPALVAMLVTGRVQESEVWLVRVVKRVYEPVLHWALRMRYPVVAASAAAFAASLLLFTTLGQEFTPTLDEKDIAMHAMRIASTSLTQSTEMQFVVEDRVRQFPEVEFVFSKTGTAEMASDPMTPNVSDTFIILKPKSEWPDPHEPKAGFVKRLEKAMTQVPGNNYEFLQPIQMRFNELIAGVRSDVAVKVYGDEFEQLQSAAEDVAAVLQEVRGSTAVKVEQTTGLPVLSITPKRSELARYGLSAADVLDTVGIALGGAEAGVVYEGDRRFDLIVRLPDSERQDLANLARLPVLLPGGALGGADAFTPMSSGGGMHSGDVAYVELGAVASIELSEGPNQISREDGKRRVVVQCNVRDRDIGSFVTEAKSRIAAEVSIPAGYWLDWGGQFENLESARARLAIVVPLCFAMILLLLYTAFSSFKYALLVFTAVPMAMTGGIIALWLRGMPFSITAAVGFIALSGVAVLNGLVMISYIN